MAKPWETTVRVYDAKAREYVNVRLALTIDWQAVANELGPKAFANKSRKSKLVAGAIVGEIISE